MRPGSRERMADLPKRRDPNPTVVLFWPKPAVSMLRSPPAFSDGVRKGDGHRVAATLLFFCTFIASLFSIALAVAIPIDPTDIHRDRTRKATWCGRVAIFWPAR